MATQGFTNPIDGESVPKVDNAVAVGEDLAFQERWWKFERIVWGFFLLVLLADVLGVFGRGWLSKAELHGANSGMDVKYERVARAMTPSVMSLEFRPEVLQNGSVQLYISNTLVKKLGVQRVVPQPERSVLGHDGITYTFPVTGPGAHVDFEMEPSFPGVHTFTLRIPAHDALNGRVVVVP